MQLRGQTLLPFLPVSLLSLGGFPNYVSGLLRVSLLCSPRPSHSDIGRRWIGVHLKVSRRVVSWSPPPMCVVCPDTPSHVPAWACIIHITHAQQHTKVPRSHSPSTRARHRPHVSRTHCMLAYMHDMFPLHNEPLWCLTLLGSLRQGYGTDLVWERGGVSYW